MFQKKKSENQLSFYNKISSTLNQRKFTKNNSYSKKTKDIFVHKQDLYFMKLIGKKIKLTKKYKSKELNQNMFKLISPINYYNNQDENNTSFYFTNKISNMKSQNISLYKNIKIRNTRKPSGNNSFINYEKNKINALNIKNDLITPKIYNKDNSKNNKKILELININKNSNNNNKPFRIKLHNNKSFINFPKIKINENKAIINNRNISSNDNSFHEFTTTVLKNKNKNDKFITLFKKGIPLDNKGKFSLIDLAKNIQNNYYKIFGKEKSVSVIKNTKSTNQN